MPSAKLIAFLESLPGNLLHYSEERFRTPEIAEALEELALIPRDETKSAAFTLEALKGLQCMKNFIQVMDKSYYHKPFQSMLLASYDEDKLMYAVLKADPHSAFDTLKNTLANLHLRLLRAAKENRVRELLELLRECEDKPLSTATLKATYNAAFENGRTEIQDHLISLFPAVLQHALTLEGEPTRLTVLAIKTNNDDLLARLTTADINPLLIAKEAFKKGSITVLEFCRFLQTINIALIGIEDKNVLQDVRKDICTQLIALSNEEREARTVFNLLDSIATVGEATGLALLQPITREAGMFDFFLRIAATTATPAEIIRDDSTMQSVERELNRRSPAAPSIAISRVSLN